MGDFMTIKKMIDRVFVLFLCGMIVLYFYESIVYSKEILNNVSVAIYRIINMVFPSLFGFMVVCDFLIRTNIYSYISVIFKPLAKYIFKIPSELFLVIILSCIGGYPVGIRLVSQLYKENKIDKLISKNMLIFCYCPSPTFIVSLVGIGLFNNVKAGLVVYLSVCIANFMVAFFVCRIHKITLVSEKTKLSLSSNALVQSVTESGKSMLKISAMIIFFAYLTTLLECMNFYNIIGVKYSDVLIKSVFEITNILAFRGNYNLLPIITFIFSTGGISILLQIVSLNSQKISLRGLFASRLPIGILSSGICFLLMRVISLDLTCNYTYSLYEKTSNYSFLSSICIFFMIITIFFRKSTSISKKSVL